ncbi:MAG TPA: DUF1080 domain-containing protein [bacterium]|nr:DUF1080 domain-containing protein [bacterium]
MNKTILLMIALAFTAGLIFSACRSGDTQKETALNTLTAEEKEEGFMLLFDGKTFGGWRGYGRESFPDRGWVIEDGALKCVGSGEGEAGGGGGDIIYEQRFKDFHLKLEWKISPKGNSGIFYLAEELEDEPIWKSAPEMQVLCNEGHLDAKLGKDGNRQAGALYDLIPAVPQNAKPSGEWNQVEIMVFKGTVVHKMNGETVLEYHLGTPDWEKMVANSKFRDFPEFGKYREGYIGLQDHGDDVWYRNIRIKEL